MFLSKFSTILLRAQISKATPLFLLATAPFTYSHFANMHTTPDIQSMGASNANANSALNNPKSAPKAGPPASAPGADFEVRQTSTTEDFTPDPSKSLKLPPNRQALLDDIIALYSCQPTIERVKRYTPDCVYDDQFVYANDRWKMAGQVSAVMGRR